MHPHYNDNCIKRILLVIKSIGRSASKCLMHLSARSKEIEPARRFLIRETFSPRNCIRAQPLQDIVGVHFYKCFYNHKQRDSQRKLDELLCEAQIKSWRLFTKTHLTSSSIEEDHLCREISIMSLLSETNSPKKILLT